MAKKSEAVALRQHHSASATFADASPMVRQLSTTLRILRMKELIERTGLSRATLYAQMAIDPTFPRKINLTARTVGWLESEVNAWLMARANACCPSA